MSIGILIGCSDTSKDSVNQSKIASNSTYEKPEYDIGLSCKDSGTNPLVTEMILLDLDQKKIRFLKLESYDRGLNNLGDVIAWDGIYDLNIEEEFYSWENIDNSKYKGEKMADSANSISLETDKDAAYELFENLLVPEEDREDKTAKLSSNYRLWKHKQKDFRHWDLDRATLRSSSSYEVRSNGRYSPGANRGVTQCELSTVDDISSDIDNVYAAKKAKQNLKLKKKQDKIDSNKI